MPATAYSRYFRQELDLQQLLARMRGGQPHQVDLKAEIADVERDWIREDVICTSCSVGSPQVVRAGQDAGGRVVRQGHFRFQSPTGNDAHHPLCEFYGNDDGGHRKGPDKVDFGQARTDLTHAIRDLVCRGLERGDFTSERMQAMRSWYFDAKIRNRFIVVGRPEIFDWFATLAQQNIAFQRDELSEDFDTFDPTFGEMPNYNWRRAAVLEVQRENASVRSLLGKATRRTVAVAGKLARKLDGQEEFDRAALEPDYKASLELARFLVMNGGLPKEEVGPSEFASKGAPAALLAFSALLLFCVKNDRREAIRMFINLTKAPAPADLTLGNIIGLNPFHDFDAWRVIKLASELARGPARSFNHFADLRNVEERMRQEHQAWRTGGGS